VSIITEKSLDDLDNLVDEIEITISFQDGDGDLGLDKNGIDKGNPIYSDTLKNENGEIIFDEEGNIIPNKFGKNFFIDVYKEVDGVYQLVVFPGNQGFSGDFPLLNVPPDNETALEGEITYSFQVPVNQGIIFEGDVLKFEIHIADRAKNLSNIVETTPIILGQ
ncbi:MAG: hypothetical protein AAGI07_19555, partial [Bacteroidota bacterium]